MEKTFNVNGKQYVALDFDLNMICDLDELGCNLKKGMSLNVIARAYFAVCSGLGKREAGAELQEHLINGGTLEELLTVVAEKLEESETFFQKKSEKKATVTKKPTK